MTRVEAKLSKTLSRDDMFWISSNSPSEIEINVTYPDGSTDRDATLDLACKVEEVIEWGGFMTGYGSWILRKGYTPRGDWNDKSSAHHH